ncbi:MAG TPA: response regulator transcription factor [Bryobacterales bacterium]|nr:response regulator transcription factor [Bryobacterales bacterium]
MHLRAFEVHAFDYLLKPFDRARFAITLERARTQLAYLRNGRQAASVSRLLAEMRPRRQPPRFAIRTADRVFFVPMEDIEWVQAADNYVCLHVGPQTHALRETMSAMEERLDPERFVRIHRSTIVNVDRIKELRPYFHGEYLVVLHNGTELTLSRTYRDRVMALLGSAL